jgi:predicted esterase
MTPPEVLGYDGTCPTIAAGVNQLMSSGVTRELIVALPSDLAPDEQLPLVFLWHWLGGDMHDFYERGDVQAAVDHYRVAAVIPNEKGDLQFKWPVEVIASEARIDEEVALFDDVLSCMSQQFSINTSCVSSIGVSAGALWTPVLAGRRGAYLSSIVSLSGGSGGFIQAWKSTPKKMPAMVLWGGDGDNCFGLMDFKQTSADLEAHLVADGHFVVECIHNCGHAPPPFALPGAPTDFAPMWAFVLAHPYWLEPGASPYAAGLPPEMPTWCAPGVGRATPREGACTDPSGC